MVASIFDRQSIRFWTGIHICQGHTEVAPGRGPDPKRRATFHRFDGLVLIMPSVL